MKPAPCVHGRLRSAIRRAESLPRVFLPHEASCGRPCKGPVLNVLLYYYYCFFCSFGVCVRVCVCVFLLSSLLCSTIVLITIIVIARSTTIIIVVVVVCGSGCGCWLWLLLLLLLFSCCSVILSCCLFILFYDVYHYHSKNWARIRGLSSLKVPGGRFHSLTCLPVQPLALCIKRSVRALSEFQDLPGQPGSK